MQTRKHELEQLRRDYKTADPETRKKIDEAGQKIKRETGSVNSMRERLIKEHRAGRMENVKDIHDRIKGKKKYGSNG